MRTPFARTPRRFFFDAAPVELVYRSGANQLRFEYKRLIPGDKVPLGAAMVNDWWISAGRVPLLHSFRTG
jgi:hypothetical protein